MKSRILIWACWAQVGATAVAVLTTSACYSPWGDGDPLATRVHIAQRKSGDGSQTADSATTAAICSCGDGKVDPDEECDPRAAGWSQACDERCQRTVYEACEHTEECPGLNSLCAAYTNAPGLFCADYCENDAACPLLPGYGAVCNFAWCALRCADGACPNGMSCLRDQAVIDTMGESKGNADICVTTKGPER